MKPRRSLRFDCTPREAAHLQLELRHLVRRTNTFETIRSVAGADISVDVDSGQGCAGVIVYSLPDLQELDRATAVGPLTFPYVPGLLSFREGPLLIEAFGRLRCTPDLLLFDGQGLAHPRRFGLACHMGVLFDRPAIGVGKSRLFGTHEQPPTEAGSWSKLVDGRQTIGAVVRTRQSVKPVFVSVGHHICLRTAVRLTLACCDGTRIPKPTREADRLVGRLRRGEIS